MATGAELAKLAASRVGDKYVNVLVPKNNPNWRGPWDCAEFVSWVVYQCTGKLYGCTDNKGNPATVESYSGAWQRDAKNGSLPRATRDEAFVTPGIVLVRNPPMPGRMGHVAISNGAGRVIEAAGVNLGVRVGRIDGRVWHHFVRVPGVTYTSNGTAPPPKPGPFVLQLETPPTTGAVVKKVQRALKAAGFNPGPIDGEFGPNTIAAVYAFQKTHRLVADGMVGPKTAAKLGLEQWP